MSPAPTTARIEDLKARLKLEPKSRLFYPLGEELRKIGRLDDSEKVLRDGLSHHPSYLSAWISLGRVLRERDDRKGAVDVLTKALALDPGNVVAARLLATTYLELGEKVEAIKKFKLVRALLPADEEVVEQIERLEKEIGGPRAVAPPPPAAPAPPPAEKDEVEVEIETAAPPGETGEASEAPSPDEPDEEFAAAAGGPAVVPWDTKHPFASTTEPDLEEETEAEQGQQWSSAAAAEPAPSMNESPSPFDEPSASKSEQARAEDEVEPWPAEERAADMPAGQDDVMTTATLGDLYARQGHPDKAREIYKSILERDPANRSIREKLDSLSASGAAEPRERAERVERLERWLSKVGRRGL